MSLSPRQHAVLAAYQRFMVSEATASLHHDLRNKLASIRNASFYLKRRVLSAATDLVAKDPRIPTFFDLIGSELSGVEAILDAMPRVAPATAGERCDLRTVVADAMSLIETHDIIVEGPAGEATAIGDPVELAVAAYCLIANAIAVAGGGVITVTAGYSDDRAVLAIVDQRAGLSADSTAPLVTTKPGLGLTIVKRIASRHRGTLELETVTPGGTRTSLVLPAAVPPDRGGV